MLTTLFAFLRDFPRQFHARRCFVVVCLSSMYGHTFVHRAAKAQRRTVIGIVKCYFLKLFFFSFCRVPFHMVLTSLRWQIIMQLENRVNYLPDC